MCQRRAFLQGSIILKSILFLGISTMMSQFGFTDDEVMKLLLDYDRSERYPDAKEWYDGYHFGNAVFIVRGM